MPKLRNGLTLTTQELRRNPESVLRGLKSPVLVLSRRYCDISAFSFEADCHFYLSPFHFWLLSRRFAKMALTVRHITIDIICC